MKKALYLVMFTLSGFLLLLPGMALPAFAASARVTTTALKSASRGATGAPPWLYPQENNQYFHGSSNSGNYQRFTGHNLGNTGNQGYNRNVNQGNSTNGGNSLINQSLRRGYRRNNQFYWGQGNNSNTLIYEGDNEGNSGNQGLNDGINQDNSTNAGNQVVN